MSKEKDQPKITIDGKDYLISELSDHQMVLVKHITELDKDISDIQFKLERSSFSREAFMNSLKHTLENVESKEEG